MFAFSRFTKPGIKALSAGCAAFLSAPVAGSEINGVVTLANGSKARDAVVWIEGGEKSKPMKSALIDQRDQMFSPHVLAITVGTTVHFPNNDSVYHNVFAEYNAKRFDLGMYPRGATKKVTFDKTGVVALLCSIHAQMSAYIYVVDTPYFAVTDRQGRFHITLPPGDYVAHVWHETKQRCNEAIKLGVGNSTITLRTAKM